MSACAYQQPPGPSRRSNTLITSNAFSRARASTAMAPEGPAPMTATRLTGILAAVVCQSVRCSAAQKTVRMRITLEIISRVEVDDLQVRLAGVVSCRTGSVCCGRGHV